jgi:hypothetical protein
MIIILIFGTTIVITNSLFQFALFEFATFMCYGSFISKSDADFYMNLDVSKLMVNPIDNEILYWYSSPELGDYIGHVPDSIFSKYYINKIGRVPRWSKLHRKINEYYIIAGKK